MAQCLFNQKRHEWGRVALTAANVGIVYFIMKNREPQKHTGREPRKRRRYTDEEKAVALVTLELNQNLDCPIAATANALQIPDSTVDNWKKGRGISEKATELGGEKKATMLELFEKAVLRGIDDILSGDKPASWRDATGIATFTDKILLLRGQPTAITENRNDAALREKAEAILAALLPEYNFNRDLALAAMRENAPTLSSYVN